MAYYPFLVSQVNTAGVTTTCQFMYTEDQVDSASFPSMLHFPMMQQEQEFEKMYLARLSPYSP